MNYRDIELGLARVRPANDDKDNQLSKVLRFQSKHDFVRVFQVEEDVWVLNTDTGDLEGGWYVHDYHRDLVVVNLRGGGEKDFQVVMSSDLAYWQSIVNNMQYERILRDSGGRVRAVLGEKLSRYLLSE